MAKKELLYKDAISEIEGILQNIESGELDVDELSKKLLKATELIKYCKEKLRKAEKDIEKIIGEADE